jgi:uncharacterized protein YvpB
MKYNTFLLSFSLFTTLGLLTYRFYTQLPSPIQSITKTDVLGQNVINQPISHIEVPLIPQTRNLSCEAATIKMVLEKYDKFVSEDDIQSKFIKDRNPHKGFRGNVNGATLGFTDYGTFAEPVSQVLGQYGIPTEVHYNITEPDLKDLLAKGNPVIVWVNRYEKNPRIIYETINGEKVKLVSGEHTVLVTGYKDNKWLINDPWGTSIKGQKAAELIEVENLDQLNWNKFDHMAVSIN